MVMPLNSCYPPKGRVTLRIALDPTRVEIETEILLPRGDTRGASFCCRARSAFPGLGFSAISQAVRKLLSSEKTIAPIPVREART